MTHDQLLLDCPEMSGVSLRECNKTNLLLML